GSDTGAPINLGRDLDAGEANESGPFLPRRAGSGGSWCWRQALAAGLSRRNLLVNLGLFAAGVWVARNLTDIDLMAPQPGA
uniref:TOM6 protein n=1 Tax=Dromaius novaehollandiae TaxID=8790 RepID=A0A8C4KBB8_DRONO